MSFRTFTKHRMRNRVKELRLRLSDTQVRDLSIKICRQILQMEVVGKANCIMTYRPFNKEADVDPLFVTFNKQKKRCVVPRVDGELIWAYEVKDLINDFEIGYAGISEPKKSCQRVEIDQIDVVLVPGCAFDLEGDRLGWGKGFYDRFFSQKGFHGAKIGVGYNFQILTDIPEEKGDVRMDIVVTETKVITFAGFHASDKK